MSGIKRGLLATAALAAGGLLLGACATEDYVNQQVAGVKAQVDAVNTKAEGNTSAIQALNGQVQDANNKAQEAAATVAEHAKAQGFAHQIISSDESVKFDTAKWDLSDDDQKTLTALAQKLAADNQDVYVEIQGHGDSRGSTSYNMALGMKRAESARQFLASQGVPLHRMSVISYGEEKPIASNDTPEGQAANRRDTISVVSN